MESIRKAIGNKGRQMFRILHPLRPCCNKLSRHQGIFEHLRIAVLDAFPSDVDPRGDRCLAFSDLHVMSLRLEQVA